MRPVLLIGLAASALCACPKVPLTDLGASFPLAEATWFAEEQTLFVFYRVEAQQGLGPQTQMELSWRTDDGEQEWTALQQLTPVHTHLPVDCGTQALCGSMSVRVAKPPREVGLRMKYHRDGDLALPAPIRLNIIRAGPAHRNRSLVVYGVMDEGNLHVQWRARHQFPSLRNMEVEALGLRRSFSVQLANYGELALPADDNAYGYGLAPACPEGLTPLDWPKVETLDRAIFQPQALPLLASDAPHLCAVATVTDALGTFSTAAVARKNPQTRPAFPTLRSPSREVTVLRYRLRPCQREPSNAHLAMQTQRLLMEEGAEEICIDDVSSSALASTWANRFQARVDAQRIQGADMVLAIVLHRDAQSALAARWLEQALDDILPPEGAKSSPRLTGAFVFDSEFYEPTLPAAVARAIWCPANLPDPDDLDSFDEKIPRYCAISAQVPDFQLGPFRLGNLPILPTQGQYLRFLERYSEAQAGRTQSLRFLAPERTPQSEDVQLDELRFATFFNNEVLTAAPTDAFSYCPEQLGGAVMFRRSSTDFPQALLSLPQAHAENPSEGYSLGLAWDFPYYLELNYATSLAGNLSVLSLNIPFGISTGTPAAYGSNQWTLNEVNLEKTLLQCTRFCSHPTFDSAGVYQVLARFNAVYGTVCYRPKFPVMGEGGFPNDP